MSARFRRPMGLLVTVLMIPSCVLIWYVRASAGAPAKTRTAGHTNELGAANRRQASPQKPSSLGVTIDGATTPELIPDNIAFSLFFKTLDQRHNTLEDPATHRDALDRGPLRAYVTTLFNRVDSRNSLRLVRRDESPSNALALRQQRQDRVIAFMKAHEPDIDAVDALRSSPERQYPAQRAALVLKMRAALPRYLGVQDAQLMESYVTTIFKTHVRQYGRELTH